MIKQNMDVKFKYQVDACIKFWELFKIIQS